MRVAALVLLGCTTAFLSAAAQDVTIEEQGKTPIEAKFSQNGRIRLDVCPSGVRIVGRDQALLRVSYHAQNGDIDAVRVQIKVSGSDAGILVRGCPHNNFQLTIEVPKASNLYARMFAGQMDVDGISGDKDVEIHAGQLTMELGRPEDYAHVDASVVSGDLQASAFAVSKGGLFRSFDRSGPGKFRVHAHVGAGQLDLR